MKKKLNKFRIIQIKSCTGTKADYFSSSTDDINVAFQRIANIQQRIAETGRHTSGYYGACSRTYYGGKCKAQFEVREIAPELDSKDSKVKKK